MSYDAEHAARLKDIKTFGTAIKNTVIANNAGAHNAIYRGKNLGSAITQEQSAAIRAGTFIDIYPGDYWHVTVPAYSWTDAEGTEHEESGFARSFFVLGCNSMLSHGGGGGFATNHIVVMAQSNLYNVRMNASATTEGGYYGSEMYTKNLLRAEAIAKVAFGEDHILLHPDFISNAVTDGKESGWIGVENRIVDLLSEDMIFGHKIHGAYGATHAYGISQLPFFAHNPVNIRSVAGALTWLRDVHNASQFATISTGGGVGVLNANNASWGGVNPFFLVY